jgi:HSP20 family protein
MIPYLFQGDATMRQNASAPFHPLWGRLAQFQREMNHLFNNWEETNVPAGSPPVNLWEEGDKVVLEAEVPGLALEDLELFVSGVNQVTLRGTRKAPAVAKGVCHRQERTLGNFARTLTLPFPVDAEKVEAKLENGVLTVKLAKHAAALPRKIAVKAE